MLLLVAGGQLDPNIGRLLRRVLERNLSYVDVLAGPGIVPVVSLEYPQFALSVSGRPVSAKSVFLRHDAFWQDSSGESTAQACALNWYYLIRGWARATNARMFNTQGAAAENNKIDNLLLAQSCGLTIPETIVTNDLALASERMGIDAIVKPVAGGSYTRTLEQSLHGWNRNDPLQIFPRFVQRRLARPELRIYIVGDRAFAFHIECDELDYREHNDARIAQTAVPTDLEAPLRKLCGNLGLDFAAADFMKREGDGACCFLEINAQPMFVAFDMVADGRLVDAMLDFLVSPDRE